ncbi:MAG: hypothetical protein GX654_21180 [Desulfatiglans sp.]|nr:hypothetical protein [Desulfatiglans sp.]
MTEAKLPGDKVQVIRVPSLTKDRKEIPKELRDQIIRTITEKFDKANGGSERIEVIGSYFSDIHNESISESITRIESHGINPFTKEEIEKFTSLLQQECIMRQTSYGVIAYLIDDKREDEVYPKELMNEDGTKFLIERDGDKYTITEFDKFGSFRSIEEYSEDDLITIDEGAPDEVLQAQFEEVEENKKNGLLDDDVL